MGSGVGDSELNSRPSGDTAALAGVRVLEASVTRAGRVAGMLLADLGAEVVRAELGPSLGADGSTLSAELAAAAASGRGVCPDELWWDRGKRVVRMSPADVARSAGGADVLIVDQTPARLAALGLAATTLAAAHPALCHVWLPPYGERGEWAEVAEDPLLLAGLSGAAARYPATWDCPVASVTPTLNHLHGALGAAAAIAALIGRDRTAPAGRGHAVVVSGLAAASAQLGMMTQVGHDQPVVKGYRSGRSVPYWRIYQAADDRWLFLAALVPEIFFRALDAMDRMDVLVLPGVDGDWNKIQIFEHGGRIVAEELEAEFRKRPMREWLELFAAADVPCAPISIRSEWAASDIVAANHALLQREHPALGPVSMPAFPADLTGTPAAPGEITTTVEDLPADGALWRTPAREAADATAGAGAQDDERPLPLKDGHPLPPNGIRPLPLTGIRVVDLSSFLAGPLIGEIMADWGADVIKVEPPTGDPFRAFPLSVLVASQHKRGLSLDITQPAGAQVLLRLLRDADLFVENMRPGRMDRLGLSDERIAQVRPDLVRCSVSAYGHASGYADAPGFDPVFQALSGLADAQGGDGDPVLTPIPINDSATATLGLLGALAALYARGRTGAGQRLHLSLANSATFLQGPDFVDFPGRPAHLRGATNFLGPSAGHRYYQCADGWLGVAARTEARLADLADLLGVDRGTPELANAIAAAFATRPLADALAALASRGIPAAPAVMDDDHINEPHLAANGYTHLVTDPEFGRFSVVHSYGVWPDGTGRPPARSVQIGHDTREILTEAGYTAAEIDALLATRAATQAAPAATAGKAPAG